MPEVGPVATVAGLTLLGPSPYLCQLCFMFIRVFVGLGLRGPQPSVFRPPVLAHRGLLRFMQGKA